MRFDGSMTNSVFQVWKDDGCAVIVRLRVDWCGRAVNRSIEHAVFCVLSDAGIGPKMLVEFDNGRVEEYLYGYKAIQGAARMKERRVADAIAHSLARFHAEATRVVLASSCSGTIPTLKNRLHSWCMYIQERLTVFSPHVWVSEFLANTLRRMDELFPPWTRKALLHGDLQCGNIMLREPTDEGKLSIRLIDYDYSGYGDVAWDIGNHFNEHAADYLTDPTRALFNWSALPTEKEKKAFIQAYVMEMHAFPSSQWLCDDENVLLQLSEHYMHVSHVYYCAWALVIHADSRKSQTELFDYLGYAHERYLQSCSHNPVS